MSDLSKSIIRSVTPIIVGAVVALLAHLGLSEFSGAASAEVVVLVAAAYSAGVRVLEKKWPQLGILLGVPGAPAYAPKPTRPFPTSTK